jgi:hypothetical protein
MIRGVSDPIEVNEIRAVREDRERLDLAAVGETVELAPEPLLGHVAGLHGEHGHPVFTVEGVRRDRQRGNVPLVPVEDEQVSCAVRRR